MQKMYHFLCTIPIVLPLGLFTVFIWRHANLRLKSPEKCLLGIESRFKGDVYDIVIGLLKQPHGFCDSEICNVFGKPNTQLVFYHGRYIAWSGVEVLRNAVQRQITVVEVIVYIVDDLLSA